MISRYRCLVVALIALVVLIGCSNDEEQSPTVPEPTPVPAWTIKYEIAGTATVVTAHYTPESGESVEIDPLSSLPWSYEFTARGSDFPCAVDAHNNNSTGTVITRIYKDGVLKSENEVTGNAFVSSCADLAGQL